MTIHPIQERTWTKEEYYQLAEQGYFKGQRVELIGGRLMVLSPQNAPHGGGVDEVQFVLNLVFHPQGYHARSQLPLDLGAATEPEPDLTVMPMNFRRHRVVHPTSAVLIVEISDSSLAYDRGLKASLYASTGILDYWIINLVTPQLEVYRDPVPDPTQHFGSRYANRTDYLAGDIVSPLVLPAVTILVADLLP